MEIQSQQIDVFSSVNDERTGSGTIWIEYWRSQQKITQCVRVFILFGGIAFVTVFVPILHFVLVPGFLIVGFYRVLKLSKIKWFLTRGEVECPNCKNLLKLKPEPLQLPTNEVCSGCGYNVIIRKK